MRCGVNEEWCVGYGVVINLVVAYPVLSRSSRSVLFTLRHVLLQVTSEVQSIFDILLHSTLSQLDKVIIVENAT